MKKTLAAVSIGLSLVCTQVYALQAEIEPNNRMSEANPIISGEVYAAQLSSESDQDWFSFVAAESSVVSVKFEHDSSAEFLLYNQWIVETYNSEEILLGAVAIDVSDQASQTTTFYFGAGYEGNYYVRVIPANDDGGSDYDLNLRNQYVLTVVYQPGNFDSTCDLNRDGSINQSDQKLKVEMIKKDYEAWQSFCSK